MLHDPALLFLVIVLAGSAVGCLLHWMVGRLRETSAWVDDTVYPGSPAHQAALQSVADGTAPNLTVWRHMRTDKQAAYDEAALNAAEAAQVAAERASSVNALYRP